MTDKQPGFWASLQGIITAIATLITALTGLYIAIGDGSLQAQAKSQDSVVAEATKQASVLAQQPAVITAVEKTAVEGAVVGGTAGEVAEAGAEVQGWDKSPFPTTGPLLDCRQFPTVNTLASLMSWSNYYHRQIVEAQGVEARAQHPCSKTIDYRGMAHCKELDNSEVRQALFDSLSLCRAAGIEWTDIEHSTIIGQQ